MPKRVRSPEALAKRALACRVAYQRARFGHLPHSTWPRELKLDYHRRASRRWRERQRKCA